MTADELFKKSQHYDDLAQKKYYEYQQSGDARYDREQQRYDELATVYKYAAKYKQEHDADTARRIRNMRVYIKEHIIDSTKKSYTKDEVESLADNFIQFCY